MPDEKMGAPEITAEDINRFIEVNDLVPVPPELMPRVLAEVRAHRAAMRRFAESGISVRDVFPAQVFRP